MFGKQKTITVALFEKGGIAAFAGRTPLASAVVFLRYPLLYAFLLFIFIQPVNAAWLESTQSGSWGDSQTWNPAQVPVNGDGISINSGHEITYNGNLSLTSGQLHLDGGRLNVYGNLTIGSSVTIGSSSNGGELFVYGDFTLSASFPVDGGATIVVMNDMDATNIYLNNGLLVVYGNLDKSGTVTADNGSDLVVAGDYSSTGGSTWINSGDMYVFGDNDCTDQGCSSVQDQDDWQSESNPPGEEYLESEDATYSSSGTFNVPSGVTTLIVECWGGGGGGGNASHNGNGTSRGGGGAGGSFASKTITSASGSYTVTVGGGGTGGNSGSASWFGSTSTVYAQGGAAGSSATKNDGTGGAGSVSSSIGDATRPGGDGGDASTSGSGGGGGGAGSSEDGKDASDNTPGGSASSNGGAGGSGITNSSGYYNGNSGSEYGGGGSGAISIGNPGTATTGGSGAGGLVFISWSDQPFVSFSSATTSLTEAGTTINVTVELSSSSSSNVSIPFSISASSTAAGGGTDYTLNTSSPLSITAGNTSTNISITIISDTDYEPDETIIIELGTPTNAELGSPDTHTVTIENDDTQPTQSLSALPSTFCIGDTVSLEATVNSPVGCSDIDYYEYSTDGGSSWNDVLNPAGTCSTTHTPTVSGTYQYRYYYYKNAGNNGYSNTSTVTVNPLPTNTYTMNDVALCHNSSTSLTLSGSESGVDYQLRDNSDDSNVGSAVSGTGSSISFTNLSPDDTTTYNVLATNTTTGCEAEMTDLATINVLFFNAAAWNITGLTGSDSTDSEPASRPAICPELNPPDFNPDDDNYDCGATYVDFRIDRDSSLANWQFDFSISGATVLETTATGDVSTPSLAGGTVNAGGNNKVYLRFKVDNVTETQLDILFDVDGVLDTDNTCGETGNFDDNDAEQIINPMPEVGSFE